MRSRILLAGFLLCALAPALGALEVPPEPDRWITDRAGILSTTELALLDTKLENFEQSSGAQFIIYIFPGLDGDAMEEFTIRAARAWGVGQAKYKNGLVLFVFVRDRKARIEVGDGLEGTITDAFSSRVIREILAPSFQRGAYAEGFNAAADAVIQKIRTGEEPVPPQPAPRRAEEGGSDLSPFTIVIILFVVFFIVLPMLSRRGGRGGGCGGCLPLFFFPGFGGGGVTFGGGGFSGGGGGWGGGGGFSGGGGGFSGGGASGGW